MKYKYETHMHTSQGSACGNSTGAEMARAYKEAGYTGIFVTDHFFNGNCAVDRSLPWEEKVELFCKGYEDAKEEGDKIGLDVFFGFEYCYEGADFLVYNLDKEWLLAHPDIDKWDPRKAFSTMREDGGIVIHAHPFRERGYIHHLHLFPRDIDGVEAVNGGHFPDTAMNERARLYAGMYDLPMTCGSDAHFAGGLPGCGVGCETRIEKITEYLELMQAGKLEFLAD